MNGKITSTEAAAILGVTASRVRQLARQLHASKVGRDLFFDPKFVRKFVKRPCGRPKACAGKG